MTDQEPTYQAAPVTQRDGSSLANANCRMASIATGLDYHSKGAERSTGKAMRSHQDDQSGGTDSGDARQAWDRGYDQGLDVEDGKTWADALAALRAGRMVHLDVWHATTGGPCLSGSGAYGHTMAVAPDCADGKWLVADPWCSPGKWSRVAEAKLKAGAETWGGQVYGKAAQEPDWPTGGGPINPRDALVLVIVARIVKRLMDQAYPGREGRLEPVTPPDTGGAQPILYTITRAQALVSPGGNDVGIAWRPLVWEDPGVPLYLDSACTDKVTTTTAGGELTTLGAMAAKDPDGFDYTAMAVLVTTSKLRDDGANMRAVLWAKRADLPDDFLTEDKAWAESLWALALEPEGRWPCPDDGDVAARDAEWRAWVLEGSPDQA